MFILLWLFPGFFFLVIFLGLNFDIWDRTTKHLAWDVLQNKFQISWISHDFEIHFSWSRVALALLRMTFVAVEIGLEFDDFSGWLWGHPRYKALAKLNVNGWFPGPAEILRPRSGVLRGTWAYMGYWNRDYRRMFRSLAWLLPQGGPADLVLVWRDCGGTKLQNIVFRGPLTLPSPGNHKNEDLLVFRKVKVSIY